MRKARKLKLSKETLRDLQLRRVAGAGPRTTSVYEACSDSCYSDCGQVSCEGSTCSYPPNCYASYPDICTPGPV